MRDCELKIDPKTVNFSWLNKIELQALLKTLSLGEHEARVVGGAVRNSLLERPISDIDIATTTLPEETMRLSQAAGYKAIATGIDYGTVTVIVNGHSFEVTTLRSDLSTDGRHAHVLFGRDWQSDAERRDFTMNALYLDRQGNLYDYTGGVADIERGVIRFIGTPSLRISEDYLRILRFFRFFAWYGSGRPDTEALKAVARLKEGLRRLSVERVWYEIKKLLEAPEPARALLWMRQTGVLNIVLPESEKWGIDAIHALITHEQKSDWPIDPILRLESIVPPDELKLERLALRLKVPRAVRQRLKNFARISTERINSERHLKSLLMKEQKEAIVDHLKLVIASSKQQGEAYHHWLQLANNWEPPHFPVNGRDLIALGFPTDRQIGTILEKVRAHWIESDFKASREELLQFIKNTCL